jgi:hypothetical protein
MNRDDSEYIEDIYEGDDNELRNIDRELCADKLQFKWIRNNYNNDDDIAPVYPDIRPITPAHPDNLSSSSSDNNRYNDYDTDKDIRDIEDGIHQPSKRQKLDNDLNLQISDCDRPDTQISGGSRVKAPPVQATRIFGTDIENGGGGMIYVYTYVY